MDASLKQVWLCGHVSNSFFWSSFSFVLLIEESEVVWIFLWFVRIIFLWLLSVEVYAQHFVRGICLHPPLILHTFMAGWSTLLVAYALVAMIATKYSMSTILIVAPTYIILIIGNWVPRSVFVRVSDGCGCIRDASLTYCVTSSALIEREWSQFWLHVLSLWDLWAILHAVCLLNKEHVSMILRCLHNLGTRSSWFKIYSIAIIWLGTGRIICLRHGWDHWLWLASISSSEAAEARRVHLFL